MDSVLGGLAQGLARGFSGEGCASYLLYGSGAACLQLVEVYQVWTHAGSASASQGQGCPSPGVAERGEVSG